MQSTRDKTIAHILDTQQSDEETMLSIFDQGEPMDIDFMTGCRKGIEIDTHHAMNGVLTNGGWYGKIFHNSESVHPLVFYSNHKNNLFAISPKYIPMGINFPKTKWFSTIMKITIPLLHTKKSKARLRMMEYRGRYVVTMIYDDKPIFDHFVKITDNLILGCMDLKGNSHPFFWFMERDDIKNYQTKL